MSSSAILTAEQFARVAGLGDELVRGRVVRLTPTGWAHGDVTGELLMLMRSHAKAHDLGLVVPEVGFVLSRAPDTVRGPDVAFVARDRVPSPLPERGFAELVPDLAVEVVSPGDADTAVRERVDEYLAAGVREVWVVDPRRRRVEIHLPGGQERTLGPEDDLTTSLLPGLSIRVGRLL